MAGIRNEDECVEFVFGEGAHFDETPACEPNGTHRGRDAPKSRRLWWLKRHRSATDSTAAAIRR
jgi:hypothetical protein